MHPGIPARKGPTEMQRILALPVDARSPEDTLEELVQRYTDRFRVPGGTWTLFPAQALALAVIEETGGLLASIMVGGGKTLIASLAPRVLGIAPYRTMLLTRAKLVDSFYREQRRYGAHFDVDRNIRVFSYDKLSHPNEGPRLLEELRPDLIIADEAHALKAETSSRRKRFARYFEANPDCRFVAMSGTMTKTSIYDYHHLARIALGDGSPLPRAKSTLETWAACLDVARGRGPTPEPHQWRAMEPLVREWAPRIGEHAGDIMARSVLERQSLTRRCYFARLASTPGVVHTRTDRVGASLEIHPITDLEVPASVRDALTKADREYLLPDDEEIESPLAKARVMRQLVQGLFYVWDWPDGPDLAWLSARRAYARAIRQTIEALADHRDSPALVERSLASGELDDREDLVRAWGRWALHSHKPAPPTAPVWLDRYLVEDAFKRAQKARGTPPALVWYEHRHVAQALHDLGMDVYWPEEGRNPEDADPAAGPVALSVHAHTDGLNLQHRWHRNLVLCPPTDGGTWEQMIGRTHRTGQEADTVTVEVYAHARPYVNQLNEAIRRARYIEQVNGQQQKLLIADWTNDAGGALDCGG